MWGPRYTSNKQQLTLSSLRRVVFHKAAVHFEARVGQIKCGHCPRAFHRRDNRRDHVKRIHWKNFVQVMRNGTAVCKHKERAGGLCQQRFQTLQASKKHVSQSTTVQPSSFDELLLQSDIHRLTFDISTGASSLPLEEPIICTINASRSQKAGKCVWVDLGNMGICSSLRPCSDQHCIS